MIGGLQYGQHPRAAMPLRSWPARGRVGIIIVAVSTRRYGGNAAGAVSDESLFTGIEIEELSEFIEIIVISGILE